MEKKQNCSVSTVFSFKYLIAFLFILSGFALLARNLGWVTAEVFDVVVSWYSLLIVLGIYSMIRRHYIGGLLLLLVGSYCLTSNVLGLSEYSQAVIWPFALIAAGILFFVKPDKRRRRRQRHWQQRRMWTQSEEAGQHNGAEQQCKTDNGFLCSNVTCGGVRHVILDELFTGATVCASFGGTIIDLRHTHIAVGNTYIDLDCSFSGVELYVPSDWKVVFQCNAFFGGCEDKRWKVAKMNEECVLVIRGNLSFGGLTVKD